jgi:hypothetical protein
VVKTRIASLKRGDHRENSFAFLERLNSASAKRATIAESVHREGDWQVDVAGYQKVSVQRVNRTISWNGTLGCY